MKRRDAIKSMGALAGAALASHPREAHADVRDLDDGAALLIDTTRCIGCRMCERACAKENGLPEPEAKVEMAGRETSPTRWTAVGRHETSRGPVTVKRQCMHCLQPACVSACLTRAMHLTPTGAVAWDPDRCMGCRFCMVSCPFDVPKFEYDSPVPRIQKCVLCYERLEAGERPACVEACPAGALTFGRRTDMLHEARKRIVESPGRYVDHIYGEREAGGTRSLYLAAVPFGELGFPEDVGDEAYPAYTREFLYAVPVVLTLLPPFLLAVSRAKRMAEVDEATVGAREEET